MALKRLIDVSTGVIVPAAELEKDPLPNAVALMTLPEAISKSGALPEGAVRLALELDGLETDEQLNALKTLNPVMLLNNPSPSLSHLHSSRRLFEFLKSSSLTPPVVHVFTSETIADKNELALQIGMRLGSLLTDGLGDGVCLDVNGPTRFTVNQLRELR